jgi:exo-beta-1,3-glucanase (GH17 family)
MLKYGKGICYSGYRTGQSPITKIYPTYEQVLEDLLILKGDQKLPFKVMLGIEPKGEISNPNCSWGGIHSAGEIAQNRKENIRQIDEFALLCNQYKDIVFAASVGNESTSDWHPNMMDAHTLAEHVRILKTKIRQKVTFCEGAYFWKTKGQELAAVVDLICIHSYPLWAQKGLDEALGINIFDYEENQKAYPGKEIIFTEFGWTTQSNDKMKKSDVSEANQAIYLAQAEKWSEANRVPMFVFEAFDEPWKGSSDPLEPEKHWGLYNVDRTPKLYMKNRKKGNV